MTALYVPLCLFSTLKFPALEHLLQTMQPSSLLRSCPCLTPFLLVIYFYSSLIFPFISYLGPFLCDNCGDMHPTPFCPKDCNSSALTCSNWPCSTAIWPCNACFCHRQQAAEFSPSDPPSCLFSPVCIDILTGGPYWGKSSDSPDSPSGKLYHYLPFLSNWFLFFLDIRWVRGPSPADIRQYASETMALAFLWFVARNPCHNITTALTQLSSLIGDTSACLQHDCQLLDTLRHAHAELLTAAASIAGGSEDEE